jgi:hypothetical protein
MSEQWLTTPSLWGASKTWTAVSLCPERDFRTEPGVLTPGGDKKTARPEGAVEPVDENEGPDERF